MTDEQRLQAITEQLLIVRDNLFLGMSKSMQKLQARSINEVLELPNFTQSPQRTWVGLTEKEVEDYWDWEDFQCGAGRSTILEMVRDIENKLRIKNA